MAREWTDLNDAGSLGSGYERDDIDRLFRPDREPPLAPFGPLDESPFGGAAEGGSHPPSMAPGAGSSIAAAEMAPIHHAAEGLVIPHDGGTDMTGPADAAACAETVTLHGAFVPTWAALAATAFIEGNVGQGLAAAEDTSDPAHGASFGGLSFGSAHGLAMLHLAPVTFGPGGMMTASIGSGQGDAAMNADIARSEFGVTGAGIKIGVLSDSFNELGGAALDESDGNLPPASQVHVLREDPFAGGTDEGRAMMEVIHDVAPNASLDFYSAEGGQQAVVNGIAALKADGCNIIVDDVIYLDEPFFQDDAISQEIHNVVAQDTPYFTAAGNDAANAYQSSFHPVTATMPDGTVVNNAQNFNFGGGPAVAVQNVTIGAGATIIFTLQWDEAYGHSVTDMELRAYQSGVLLGTMDKFATGEPSNPLVQFVFPNPNSVPVTIQLAIDLKSGPAPSVIKYVALGDGAPVTIDNFATNSSTIFGHRMSADADTVGADLYTQTPRFGVSPPQLEFYSSVGPSEILFDSSGNRLASPEIINKVDFTAPDGISTSVPGALGVFRGTSAAAPDAAAVAALMLQANPALNPQDITNLLKDSSIPMAGFGSTTGAGLIQANTAVLGAEGIIQVSTNQFLVEGTHLNDVFVAGPGSHVLDGGGGTNVLDYLTAPSAVTVNLANDTAANGFGGTDQFSHFQLFAGSNFNDVFYAGPGNDLINGEGGTNTLAYAFAPAPVLVNVDAAGALNGFGGTDGFANIQVFVGSTFNDVFIGGPGNNVFDGYGGTNTLSYTDSPMGVFVDVASGVALNGFGGTDHFLHMQDFIGSPHNDIFVGGPGNNLFVGNGGFDALYYGMAPSGVTVNAAAGTAGNGFGGTDSFSGIQAFIGSNFNDIFIGGSGNNYYNGLGGTDTLAYANSPTGVFVNVDAGVALNGFGGTDIFANFHVFVGSPHDDIFVAGPGNNAYDGFGGNNWIDYALSPTGVAVSLAAGIAFNGFGGNDLLFNVQNVIGSKFNDILVGGPGNVTLTGGGGNDWFAFRDGFGSETITDFTASTGNVLDLSGVSQFHSFADIQAHWAQVGSNVVITDPLGGSVTIQNTTTAYLTEHQNEFIP